MKNDEAYNWTIPACPQHPELRHAKCLLWWDGPLTNVFRDANANGYILHWGDRTATSDVYVLLPLEKEVLERWNADESWSTPGAWRRVFLTAPHAFLVTISEHQTHTSEKKTLQEIEEYLPGERDDNV